VTDSVSRAVVGLGRCVGWPAASTATIYMIGCHFTAHTIYSSCRMSSYGVVVRQMAFLTLIIITVSMLIIEENSWSVPKLSVMCHLGPCTTKKLFLGPYTWFQVSPRSKQILAHYLC